MLIEELDWRESLTTRAVEIDVPALRMKLHGLGELHELALGQIGFLAESHVFQSLLLLVSDLL